MLKKGKTKFTISLIAVVGFLLLAGSSFAQEKGHKKEYIQAQAMGESTQLGRSFA